MKGFANALAMVPDDSIDENIEFGITTETVADMLAGFSSVFSQLESGSKVAKGADHKYIKIIQSISDKFVIHFRYEILLCGVMRHRSAKLEDYFIMLWNPLVEKDWAMDIYTLEVDFPEL